ncbi:hypothetical protein OAG92_04855 [Akkermansiaceae bacterium]|nr:hypothetical protein [bacterium]MDB4801558.1 hypothetical protein [Akkermansiaceae bacterium]
MSAGNDLRSSGKLVALPGGGFQVLSLPSDEELSYYYREKYFQECQRSAYELQYSEEEIRYFKNRARVTDGR